MAREQACHEDAMRALVAADVKRLGSQKALAVAAGISQQFLCDVLAGRRDVGPKLSARYGYRPITIYVTAGPTIPEQEGR